MNLAEGRLTRVYEQQSVNRARVNIVLELDLKTTDKIFVEEDI